MVLTGAAGTCGRPSAVQISLPADTAILLQPGPVAIHGSIVEGLDVTTAAVELDGVHLAAALGLAPPFAGASGVVSIGGAPVSVQGFSVLPGSPRHLVELVVAGLPSGEHAIVLFADAPAGGTRSDAGTFTLVGGFAPGPSVAVPGGSGVVAGEAAATTFATSAEGSRLAAGHLPVARQLTSEP